MFKTDEYAVYKKDVCKIKGIKKTLNGEYYVLAPIDDESLIIDVPTENKLGLLRTIISKEEALRLIDLMSKTEVINTNDKMIENEYRNLMNSGKLEDLIVIIKTTYLRNQERILNKKKIGEKDDNYFKKAEKILYNEISISLGMTFDETKAYIIDRLENE